MKAMSLKRIATLGAAALISGSALVACGNTTTDSAGDGTTQSNGATTDGAAADGAAAEGAANAPAILGADLPIDTAIEWNNTGTAETCPYMDGPFIENANGMRWTATGLDHRFDPPACVFWSYEETPQVTILVRHMPNHQAAVDVVNHFAPIDQTLKALQPEGWSGGRSRNDNTPGSVYAVFKDNTAVVVTSAQDQTVKPESIAIETINRLGL